METAKSLWLTLEINNHTMLNLLISSVLLKAFTFCQYIDSLSGAELFRWRTATKTSMQGNILLFIIDLWLNSLLLYVNETLLTFLVLHLLIEGLSIAGRYMWLNWGQTKEQKLKSKAKKKGLLCSNFHATTLANELGNSSNISFCTCAATRCSAWPLSLPM